MAPILTVDIDALHQLSADLKTVAEQIRAVDVQRPITDAAGALPGSDTAGASNPGAIADGYRSLANWIEQLASATTEAADRFAATDFENSTTLEKTAAFANPAPLRGDF